VVGVQAKLPARSLDWLLQWQQPHEEHEKANNNGGIEYAAKNI
jgi:hypothetical protein